MNKIKSNNNKKEVLKLLGIIGIDTRYISYTPNIIYINDQRFAKFSKKRQKTFKKYYPEIEIISSGILRKICIKFSEIIANEISPKNNVLILKPKNNVDYLLKIVLEPYTRKYGINIIEYDIDDIESFISNLNSEKPFSLNIDELENIPDLKFINRKRKEEKKEKKCKERKEKEETKKEEEKKKKNIESDNIVLIDAILTSLTLDEKVESILSSIFKGEGIPISNNKNKINNKSNTKNDSNTNNNANNNSNNTNNIINTNNSNNSNTSNNKKDDNKQTKVVYPFINVPNNWIDTFLDSLENELNSEPKILNKIKDVSYPDNDSSIEITKSFMEFIEEIIPQYKWNILRSSNFIEEKLNNIKND